MEELAAVLGLVVVTVGAIGSVGRLLIASFRVAQRAEDAAAAPARLDKLEPEIRENTAHRARVTSTLRRIGDEVGILSDDVDHIRRQLRAWEAVAGEWFDHTDGRLERIEQLLVSNSDEPDT